MKSTKTSDESRNIEYTRAIIVDAPSEDSAVKSLIRMSEHFQRAGTFYSKHRKAVAKTEETAIKIIQSARSAQQSNRGGPLCGKTFEKDEESEKALAIGAIFPGTDRSALIDSLLAFTEEPIAQKLNQVFIEEFDMLTKSQAEKIAQKAYLQSAEGFGMHRNVDVTLPVFRDTGGQDLETTTRGDLLRGVRHHGGRPPLGTTSVCGSLRPAKDFDRVCHCLASVRAGDMSRESAAASIGCAARTIDRALKRPSLYGLVE